MNQRLEWLDTARGVAALVVVAMHVTEIWAPFAQAHHSIAKVMIQASHGFNFGVMGVYLFFIVSGFVIPFSVQNQGPEASRQFAVRRFFRIFPLLWISIPLGALTSHWLWGKPFGASDFALNALLVPNFFNAPFAQGLYWSLQVEILFYAVVFTLVYFKIFDKTRIALLMFGSVGAAYVLQKSGVQPDSSLGIPLFLLIMLRLILLGWLLRNFLMNKNRNWLDTLAMALVVAYFLVKKPMDAYQILQGGGQGFHHLTETVAIVLFLSFYGLNLHSKLFLYLGKISYSIYLLHPVVMYSIFYWAHQASGQWIKQYDLSLMLAVTIFLTLVLSHITWTWIENPSQKFARNLLRKRA
jgi:peptidoglycan/LPS O-acetylase OafA/YrhL